MLKLIPPGKRKNKFYYLRGTLDGKHVETSLKTSNRTDAEQKLRNLIREYEGNKDINENVTFTMAAQHYIAFRKPTERDETRIDRICDWIDPDTGLQFGNRLCREFTQNDIVKVANALYSTSEAGNKNRSAIVPIASVLHYASSNKWCDHLRIAKFKEKTAKTRFVMPNVETKLLKAANGDEYLLLLWLFRQGDRITDALQVRYEDIDLDRGVIRRLISKSDRYWEFSIDEEIIKLLKKKKLSEGFVFPWRTRWAVYVWLNPLKEKVGIEFTPHRARHTLGKTLNDTGAGLRTIMDSLGQSDPKSAIRYQATDVETTRRAKQKAGKNRGKDG